MFSDGFFIEALHRNVDSARPHNRPDMATEDKIQILGVNRPNTTSNNFDFSNFEFVEQDSKPWFIAALNGKGGPASVGVYKWFASAGTQARTSNVPYAKTSPRQFCS